MVRKDKLCLTNDHHLMRALLNAPYIKHIFDDFDFAVDEIGVPEVTDDGKEVLEEALFLATSPEARGLPGFRGSTS